MATLTPNLGLTLPADLSITNPDWGVILNSDFTIIDSILGVPVTPGGVPGINIDANLPFNGWSATGLFSIAFDPQISPLDSSYFDTLYVYNNGVWFNDNAGTAHQVYPGSGSASSNVFYTAPTGTASAQYSPSLGFEFFQATGPAWYAPMNVGALNIFDDSVAGAANPVIIQSPGDLAEQYTLTLPTGIPSALSGTSVITTNTSGDMGYAQPGTVNPTIAITSGSTGSIGVVPGSLTQAYTTAPPTGSGFATVGITSTSMTDVTGAQVILSLVAGRATMVMCQATQNGSVSQLQCVDTGGGGSSAFEMQCVISGADSVPVFNLVGFESGVVISSGAQSLTTLTTVLPPSVYAAFYFPVTTGSHTFQLQAKVVNSTSTLNFVNVQFIVVQW